MRIEQCGLHDTVEVYIQHVMIGHPSNCVNRDSDICESLDAYYLAAVCRYNPLQER
jgi:hypothetical protein